MAIALMPGHFSDTFAVGSESLLEREDLPLFMLDDGRAISQDSLRRERLRQRLTKTSNRRRMVSAGEQPQATGQPQQSPVVSFDCSIVPGAVESEYISNSDCFMKLSCTAPPAFRRARSVRARSGCRTGSLPSIPEQRSRTDEDIAGMRFGPSFRSEPGSVDDDEACNGILFPHCPEEVKPLDDWMVGELDRRARLEREREVERDFEVAKEEVVAHVKSGCSSATTATATCGLAFCTWTPSVSTAASSTSSSSSSSSATGTTGASSPRHGCGLGLDDEATTTDDEASGSDPDSDSSDFQQRRRCAGRRRLRLTKQREADEEEQQQREEEGGQPGAKVPGQSRPSSSKSRSSASSSSASSSRVKGLTRRATTDLKSWISTASNAVAKGLKRHKTVQVHFHPV